ncbi:hypoxanthine phosphoribosyltransferase [Bacilli bacterium PM5-3]|nr:hypoxanthine phosphoribosyltransferase [Bacilli bacterium PM5-3]MDH6603996.1 hypoxanthine phosphoribosyltransferase [Bacilli bacterium PM5-9]
MHNDVKKILINEEQIINRTKEIAMEINNDYKGERITLVGLLSGSVPFLAELMKHIKVDCEIDFMDVSSYRGTQSTGEVRILKDLTKPIDSTNVIIVEDIIDTGKTLKVVKEILENRGTKSLKIATLLDKPEGRVVECSADYIGFTIPNEFVIGFGLDYDELYRNLPYVGVLREECYM